VFDKVNGKSNALFKARLLGPLPISAEEEEEQQLGKNHSSVIINFELADDVKRGTVKAFLTGGDAEVYIWEKLWVKHKKKSEVLSYDLLLAPHHCSWHTLSYDSRSEKGDKAEVCKDAKSALSQINAEGKIVSSSNSIEDNECDPPCHAAKKEYESIVKGQKGEFLCTDESPTKDKPEPLEFVLSDGKVSRSVSKAALPSGSLLTAGIIGALGAAAARTEAVQKGGNNRYA
jgi:hypothetical protein